MSVNITTDPLENPLYMVRVFPKSAEADVQAQHLAALKEEHGTAPASHFDYSMRLYEGTLNRFGVCFVNGDDAEMSSGLVEGRVLDADFGEYGTVTYHDGYARVEVSSAQIRKNIADLSWAYTALGYNAARLLGSALVPSLSPDAYQRAYDLVHEDRSPATLLYNTVELEVGPVCQFLRVEWERAKLDVNDPDAVLVILVSTEHIPTYSY